MRIPSRINAPFSFGIQTLLGLVGVSALMMWCGAFGALIAVACTIAHYAALSGVSIFFMNSSPTPKTPRYRNWQFLKPNDGTVLRVTATTYLVFHHTWHLFWLIVMLPTGLQTTWHAPSLGPLTLSQVEHLCLAAFSLLLITSFLSRAYAGDRFSRRICIETSTLLTFLLATHFSIAP